MSDANERIGYKIKAIHAGQACISHVDMSKEVRESLEIFDSKV